LSQVGVLVLLLFVALLDSTVSAVYVLRDLLAQLRSGGALASHPVYASRGQLVLAVALVSATPGIIV